MHITLLEKQHNNIIGFDRHFQTNKGWKIFQFYLCGSNIHLFIQQPCIKPATVMGAVEDAKMKKGTALSPYLLVGRSNMFTSKHIYNLISATREVKIHFMRVQEREGSSWKDGRRLHRRDDI